MGKLNREALGTFLDTGFNATVSKAGEAVWEIIGADIEEMSVELNSDTETKKNILGQTKTQDNGYEATMDADPFYADPESKLYPKIRDIALNRLKGSACKTLMLEVIVEDPESEVHSAWVREVVVKPQSYGGGTEGFNIPFNVSEDGAFVAGTVTSESLKAGAPVFTENAKALTN
ncbi:MAG: hypothetical protein J6R01_08115 [Alistipes sp.]|nr:hypothetical protein [Alistipes sp.]